MFSNDPIFLLTKAVQKANNRKHDVERIKTFTNLFVTGALSSHEVYKLICKQGLENLHQEIIRENK